MNNKKFTRFAVLFAAASITITLQSQPLNDTTLTGTTDIQGPVKIDDGSAPQAWGTAPTSFFWNLRLEDGLFVYGDGDSTQTLLGLDFDGTEGPLFFWYPEKAAFRAGSPGAWAWDEARIADYSFAFGQEANARGDHSIILGSNAETDSDYSVGIGYYAEIWDSVGSVSLGYGAYLEEADYSISMGRYAEAWYSTDAIVMGYSAEADGANYGVAIGRNASVEADSAVALGYSAKAEHYKSIVLGDSKTIPGSASSWEETDPHFIVGNYSGTYSPFGIGPTNAIVTLKNGQTTLKNKHWDNTAPEDVPTYPGTSDGKALIVEGHTEFKGNVTLSHAQGDISMGPFGPGVSGP